MTQLQDHHTLARSVTSGDDAKKCRNPETPIPISVFDDPSDVISTDWTDFASQAVLVQLGEERAKKRGQGRKFHGWVRLSVAAARGNGHLIRTVYHREVEATPNNLANPFHVDICLPNGVPGDVRTEHLHELVDASEWEARPPDSPPGDRAEVLPAKEK